MAKTKRKFYLIFLFVFIFVLIFYLMYCFNIIPHKKYSNKDFNIKTYISKTDADGDNIDDQTDILKNARKYINSKPGYKSKYYNTGYPDDNYGVCTDVVSNGLRYAGYDLMELVNRDITENRSLYNIEKPDKNIDFRRVQNLKIYFNRTAIKLTDDIYKIDEWQGGDIIIFEHHIGIVSDKRNKNGVPFLIHNGSPYQFHYEEDVLETRKDIIAHYRIS